MPSTKEVWRGFLNVLGVIGIILALVGIILVIVKIIGAEDEFNCSYMKFSKILKIEWEGA